MFDKRYMAVLADTDESKSIHYALRHQVYCVEKGFEKPMAGSVDAAQEKDIFDSHSVHFIVRDLLKSNWVGTLRVVLPSEESLPMMQVIGDDLLNENALPFDQVAEISRLSILSQHRHSNVVVNDHSFSEVMFSLVKAAKGYCESLGITTWVFLCRKSLSKIANRQGMEMKKIGGPCEHKGTRYPYKVSLNDAFTQLRQASGGLQLQQPNERAFQRYSEFYV